MNVFVLIDYGNFYGVLEFYCVCKKNDLNLIIGYEVYVVLGSWFDKSGGKMKDLSYYLMLLC